jgi:hypothetical protein
MYSSKEASAEAVPVVACGWDVSMRFFPCLYACQFSPRHNINMTGFIRCISCAKATFVIRSNAFTFVHDTVRAAVL